MTLEVAYTYYFSTSLASSLASIAIVRLLTTSPSSIYPFAALAIAIPLGSHALTYFSLQSPSQHDVATASFHSPSSTRINLVSFLSCATSIQRFYLLSRIDLGFRDYIYALGLIEVLIVLRLGVLFRRLFAQRSTIAEDVCEKGGPESVLGRTTEKQ